MNDGSHYEMIKAHYDISKNEGPIPTTLGQLVNVSQLFLGSNRLTGTKTLVIFLDVKLLLMLVSVSTTAYLSPFIVVL